jgi:hypothetical protein
VTISASRLDKLSRDLTSLVGAQLEIVQLPRAVLAGFEPSQVGTIVGTLVDACVPALEVIFPALGSLGLAKAPGVLGEREGYPDFLHRTGFRLELKMLYVEPQGVVMKAPPTPRESSARLTQKVTVKNVVPDLDLLFVLAYRLMPIAGKPDIFAPRFIDFGLFPMAECVAARDNRLVSRGGRWFGDYETPAVLSAKGRRKVAGGLPLVQEYGRKESEGRDFNEDTNFGKLQRIPYPPLQAFLVKHGYRTPRAPSQG